MRSRFGGQGRALGRRQEHPQGTPDIPSARPCLRGNGQRLPGGPVPGQPPLTGHQRELRRAGEGCVPVEAHVPA